MYAYRRFIFLILIPLILVGCASSSPPDIRLTALEPLPAQVSSDVIPLRVAVAAVISPKGTVESYRLVLTYLSEKLNRPVELIQRRTYSEINDLVEQGYVDVAFVCTSAYIAGHADFGMQLLAAPQVQGDTVYYSELIVPADSSAVSIADLRGKVFAFTDPMSTTGRAYPIQLLVQMGESPDSFFARTFYTYSHDDAIRAVSEGLADGAAVDNLVLAYALEREPTLRDKVKIINRSGPFGIPPVVTHPALRPQLRAQLQQVLVDMSSDPQGVAALAALGIERFVAIGDEAYDTVRILQTGIQNLIVK